jgi:hypothetical protein
MSDIEMRNIDPGSRVCHLHNGNGAERSEPERSGDICPIEFSSNGQNCGIGPRHASSLPSYFVNRACALPFFSVLSLPKMAPKMAAVAKPERVPYLTFHFSLRRQLASQFPYISFALQVSVIFKLTNILVYFFLNRTARHRLYVLLRSSTGSHRLCFTCFTTVP